MNPPKQKTLFFSLSFGASFSNLFSFPESVFFRLFDISKKDQNLKIVFIVAESFKGKFDFASYIRPNFLVEFVPGLGKKFDNFWQKLFFFFYSHLIFTKTTLMLSTMGMRPDEPAGGGRLYLAPIKWLIANTFGRLRFVRKRVVPYLYYKIYSSRPFKVYFDKYKPDMVFVPHLFGHFDQLLLAEAKKNGTKTLGMISNWDHFDKFYLPFQADKLLAQSEQVKKFAINYQSYKKDQIFLVGFPQFDMLAGKQHEVPRAEFYKNVGLPEDGRFILYISGSSYAPDEPDIIEKILKWIDSGKFGSNIYLVLRPYLGGRGKDKEFDKLKYDRFQEHPKVKFLNKPEHKEIYFGAMRHTSVAVIIYSTAFMEAVAMDVPAVSVAFDGNKKRPFHRSVRRLALREHYKDIFDTGGVRQTRNFEELYNALKNYLDDKNIDSDKREVMRKELMYKVDGRSSGRIVNKVIELLSY